MADILVVAELTAEGKVRKTTHSAITMAKLALPALGGGFSILVLGAGAKAAAADLTGFGAAKRIVFFDTLLARLAPGEIEAVLAHELGHFRRHHIVQRIAFMFAGALGFLWLLGELIARGAVGAASTHDMELCRLPEDLMTHVEQVHFQENVAGGEMNFDYKLRPGPVTAGNALRLMKIVGLDVPLE